MNPDFGRGRRNAALPVAETPSSLRWNPKHLHSPRADPQLPALDAVLRSAETLKYSVLRLEHFISPDGTLREWYRCMLYGSLVLLVPGVLFVPFLTWFLASFNTVSAYLAITAMNLMVVAAGVAGILLAIKLISRLLSVPSSVHRDPQPQRRRFHL